MADSSQDKTIALKPSWKNHIIGYSISILLIPLVGLGFLGLWLVRKQQKKYSYTFSNSQISSKDNKYQRNIDLVNIDKVEIKQSWIQQKMGVGNLTLYTSASSMMLRGMENPANLKDMLEKAITAEKQRLREKEKNEPKEPEYDPGTMDRMDYLTGLWQQGLVSDEDFKKEKKRFE